MRQLTFNEWKPGPFCDIAIINLTIEALAKEHAFAPERVVEDGLGWVSYVPLELDDGTRFLLDWAEGGTPEQMIVKADITDRPYTAAIDKLLSALDLERSAVLWLSADDGYQHQIDGLKREGRPG